MGYFDKLNNAELFATCAAAKPSVWNSVIGHAVTHTQHGRGILVKTDGLIFRIKFHDELKLFCELEFFGSQLTEIQFTNIELPPKFNREYLIETLCYWEFLQQQGSKRVSSKQRRRQVRPSELAFQLGVVKQEYIKIQRESDRRTNMYRHSEVEDTAERARLHAYQRAEARDIRDE